MRLLNIIKPFRQQNATGQKSNSIPTENFSDILEMKVIA